MGYKNFFFLIFCFLNWLEFFIWEWKILPSWGGETLSNWIWVWPYQETYFSFWKSGLQRISGDWAYTLVIFNTDTKRLVLRLNLFSIQYLNDLCDEIRSQRVSWFANNGKQHGGSTPSHWHWKDLVGFVQIRNGKYQGTDVAPSQFHQMEKLVSSSRRHENVIPVVDGWEERSKGKGQIWKIENNLYCRFKITFSWLFKIDMYF